MVCWLAPGGYESLTSSICIWMGRVFKEMKVFDLLSLVKPFSSEDVLSKLFDSSDPVQIISFCNAQALDLATRDNEFLESLVDSDFLLRDGIGIKVLLKIFGLPIGENLNGTDFIPKLLGNKRISSVVLLGSEDYILDRARDVIEKDYGKTVLDAANGFDHDINFYELLLSKYPNVDLIIVAMGMPKQEILAATLRKSMEANGGQTLVVCGGAILSFMVGEESRAPNVFRKFGLEWFWRMINDPSRLAKRYYSNALLIAKLIKYRMMM